MKKREEKSQSEKSVQAEMTMLGHLLCVFLTVVVIDSEIITTFMVSKK